MDRPLDLDRTEPARHELRWVPARIRAERLSSMALTASGTLLAAAAAVAFSAGVLAPVAAIGLGVGLLAAGQVGRSTIRRRLEALASGGEVLGALEAVSQGRLVHVRGRVRATSLIEGLLHGRPGVLRRTVVQLGGGGRLLHEAGVNFQLVEAGDEPVTIHVAEARLLFPRLSDLMDYPARLFAPERLPPSLAALVPRPPSDGVVPAAERVIEDGEWLDIIGYTSSDVDPSAPARLGRAVPMRGALRAGAVPLIIAPAPVEARPRLG